MRVLIDIPDEELRTRLMGVKLVDRPVSGLLSKYRQLVTTAARGAVVE